MDNEHPRSADAVVIGGGFYGATIALELARRCERVLVIERGADILTRASYANQARVHAGYHYPRSMMTALRSSINFARFVAEYEDCIDASFTKLYAIARESKVTAQQFQKICREIGAPLKLATEEYGRLFNPVLVDEVFEAREVAFDAAKLRARLKGELEAAGVEVLYEATVRRVAPAAGGRVSVDFASTAPAPDVAPDQTAPADRVETGRARLPDPGDADGNRPRAFGGREPAGPDAEEARLTAGQVYCCAYAQNNTILRNSGLPLLPLKNELAEVPLLEPPDPLRGIGVTIMDGSFFSVMPFPARGLHSIHHVRYSPHHWWHDQRDYRDAYAHLDALSPRSNYPLMIRDAARYVPCLADASYVESLFEIKAVLTQNEIDDGRPILYRAHHGIANFSVLLGAKIDNIYDVVGALAPTLASRTAPPVGAGEDTRP